MPKNGFTLCNYAAAVLGALLVGTGINVQAQGSESQPLETAVVVREVAALERLFDGTVEAVNQATISAQTNARVAELKYDVNDYVEAGAPMIRFTDVEQQAALKQAQAALNIAVARQRESESEFQRASGLFESGSGSKREYDSALAARDASVARVKSAESAIVTARERVEYTLLRAPYAGIVTARHVEVGEAVTVGQPLMAGLSLEQLRVVVDLPQRNIRGVREHLKATVLTEEGRIAAENVTIFPFADTASNTFRVRVDMPSGQFGLYPGMFVKIGFIVGDAQRLLIPRVALLQRGEVTAVYVIDDTDTVRLRQVRIGNTFNDRVEILAGLREGEYVATDPLRAGILVKTAAAQDRG